MTAFTTMSKRKHVPAIRRDRTLLDRQGQSTVAETLVAGDEDTVAAAVRAYADAGATDVLVSLVGDDVEKARTLELAGELARSL
jgi:alkanesulfonate monooxygenase SsuD/methylene tetrahydromethanopterin reductase-like flavin-dependent oxidoreductase (luciferase family)